MLVALPGRFFFFFFFFFYLLTFFNKECKMEAGNVAVSLCLIIMLVQH